MYVFIYYFYEMEKMCFFLSGWALGAPKFTDSDTLWFCIPKGNLNVTDLGSPVPSSPEDLWILYICPGLHIHLVLPAESGSCRHHLPERTVQVWYTLKKKIRCYLSVVFILPSYFTLPQSQVQEVSKKSAPKWFNNWNYSSTAFIILCFP